MTYALPPTTGTFDGPWYRVQGEGFGALFRVTPEEPLDQVCNVDVEVHLPDGARWGASVFTLAEVDRLMSGWESTGEAAAGRAFWSADALIVREPGIPAIVEVIAALVRSGELDGPFHLRSLP